MPYMPPTTPTRAASTAVVAAGRENRGEPPAGVALSANHNPRGTRTAPMTASKASGPGTSSTRMVEPATTPGMVPANSTAVSRPPV